MLWRFPSRGAEMRILISRLGAFGDSIILSSVIHKLKSQGHEIILHTGSRGVKIFKDSLDVDELIAYKDNSVPNNELVEYLESFKEKVEADIHIDYTGSIENSLALHPNQPEYSYPRDQRAMLCDKSYYEEAFNWADVEYERSDLKPHIDYTKSTEKKAKSYIRPDSFNILWVMSGSGGNKAYPFTEYVIGEILNKYKNVHIITVGDYRCKLLESHENEYITNLSGETDILTSMCLTKHVDLVISPDTGVLHASGQFNTPKIGLLGHTSIKNITSTFDNDHSIQANCNCAPCYRLIYGHSWQCPIDIATGATWCMSEGMGPERVFKAVKGVIPDEYRQ